MIFTQRFFTALLGLLFASVLTDQASALYDPGVGRFCSRDPIGYADSLNSYQSALSMSQTDFSGYCAQCCCCADSLLLSAGPLSLTTSPPELGDEIVPGLGHDFTLDARMSFYQTDGPSYPCKAYWWEWYVARLGPGKWRLSGDPDRREKVRRNPLRIPPSGGTMGNFWDFLDEFARPDFACRGSKAVQLRDKPFSSSQLLEDNVRLLYFHVILDSGLGCVCSEKSVAWEGCQVIGIKDGRNISYFGKSKAECSKQAISTTLGGWWNHEWPDFLD